jgi:hypothetical protein
MRGLGMQKIVTRFAELLQPRVLPAPEDHAVLALTRNKIIENILCLLSDYFEQHCYMPTKE